MVFGRSYLFDLAIKMGVLANKSTFDLSLLKSVQTYSLFFKVVYIVNKYRMHLEHAGANRFLIKKLHTVVELESSYVDAFVDILANIDWLNKDEQGRFHMCINGCDFIIPFPYGALEVYETFSKGWYDTPVEDATVLDIGGFVGDTGVFFAKRGAKKVFVYEPAKSLYNLSLENIVLNKVEDKVTVYNVAVGAEDGEATFKFCPLSPGRSSFAASGSTSEYKVKVVSITRILNKPVDLLKMDCEGAEHEIVDVADRTGLLKNAKRISLEIHGEPTRIVSILKKNGFAITEHLRAPDLAILEASQCIKAGNARADLRQDRVGGKVKDAEEA